MSVPVPASGPEQFWTGLRSTTPARIGLPRHGNALSTRALLELDRDHAAAVDAIYDPLRPEDLRDPLIGLGWGEPVVVRSQAADRTIYLRRPDLGRRLATRPPVVAPTDSPDLVVVLGDGLSSRAVHAHAVPLLIAIKDRLNATVVAAPVVALQARVALGDAIAEQVGASGVLVLLGERPGLSSSDSLGAYLTLTPRPGRTADSERNCVSNIRPPVGLAYEAAASTLVDLWERARRSGATGVGLKAKGLAIDIPTGMHHIRSESGEVPRGK